MTHGCANGHKGGALTPTKRERSRFWTGGMGGPGIPGATLPYPINKMRRYTMNIDLTPIIQAILALLAALITYKLVPWIKAKTTNEQRVYLKATIKTLVFAAEQLYGAGAGAEKLDYVVKELNKRGFDVDRAEIEATVNEFFGKISHETTATYTESMDADEMTDNQIRAVLIQVGASMSDIEACKTRAELEKLLDSYAVEATDPPTRGGVK